MLTVVWGLGTSKGYCLGKWTNRGSITEIIARGCWKDEGCLNPLLRSGEPGGWQRWWATSEGGAQGPSNGLPQSSPIVKLFSRLDFEIKVLLLRERKETFLKWKTTGAVYLPISLIESERLRKLIRIMQQGICAIRSRSCPPGLGSSEAPCSTKSPTHLKSPNTGIKWRQLQTLLLERS